MAAPSVCQFTLLVIFWVNLCLAQDVTVYLNDTSLVTEPPNWWGRPEYPMLCGGSRWTNLLGQNISLAFTGTAVTVNFILEYAGAIAQVTLDGTDVTHVNTFVLGQPDAACAPYAWRSGNLSEGLHTITITQLGSGNPANPSVVYVWLSSFVYTSSPDPSNSNANPASTSSTTNTAMSAAHKKSAKVGAIIGAVVGVLAVLLLVMSIMYLRHRQRQRLLRSSPLLIDGHNFHGPETPGFTSKATSMTGSAKSNSLAFQSAAPSNVQQPFHADLTSMMSAPTQPSTVSDINSNWSSTPSSPVQGGAIGNLKAPTLRLFDPGSLHLASPQTSPTNSPINPRLTPSQLEFLHHLSKQNVPGPALATVIDSMAGGTQFSAGEPELGVSGPEGQVLHFGGEDAPPGYYSQGA